MDIKIVKITLEVTESAILKLFCFYFCHQVAVDSLKRVFSWGWGGLGRLGHAEQKDEMIPRLIKFFDTQSRGVKSVHCGSSFSLAINELGKREESRNWNCGMIATDLLECTRPVLWWCLYKGHNDLCISLSHPFPFNAIKWSDCYRCCLLIWSDQTYWWGQHVSQTYPRLDWMVSTQCWLWVHQHRDGCRWQCHCVGTQSYIWWTGMLIAVVVRVIMCKSPTL